MDVIFKAFSTCAASQGCMNNTTFGDDHFGYYETVAGGAGAVGYTRTKQSCNIRRGGGALVNPLKALNLNNHTHLYVYCKSLQNFRNCTLKPNGMCFCQRMHTVLECVC